MNDLNKKRSSRQARAHGATPPSAQAPDGNATLAAAVAEAVKSTNGGDAIGAAPHAGVPLGTSSPGGLPARAEAANAPATAPAPAPVPVPEIVQAPASRKRVKAVRASYAVPKDDLATLDALKDACRGQGVKAKKNQLLRVAIGLLREVEPARLAELVGALPPTAHKRK